MSLIYEIKTPLNGDDLLRMGMGKIAFHGPTPQSSYFASEASVREARLLNIPFEILKSLDVSEVKIPMLQSFPAILMKIPTPEAKEEALAYALAHGHTKSKTAVIYLGRDVNISEEPGAFFLDRAGGRRKYAWKLVDQEKDDTGFSIEKSFSNIKSRIQDPDTKVVVAFGGGGLRVFAHTTLVKFLNALGIYDKIDEIWGTSAGAIAALWYASGVSPELVQKKGYDLYNHLFSLKLSPSKLEVLKNLFINYCLPEKMRPSGFLGFINCTKSIADFITGVKQDAPLRKPFYCLALNIQNLKTEVLTSETVDGSTYSRKIHKVDPLEAAVASSCVPILFVPKSIYRDGTEVQYIDGGIEENTPLKSIYEKWVIDKKRGFEKRKRLLLISSSLQSEYRLNLFDRKHLNEHSLVKITFGLLFQAIENSHRALLAQDPFVEVWDFQMPLNDYPLFNVKFIPEFIKSGYQEVAQRALEIEQNLQAGISSGRLENAA